MSIDVIERIVIYYKTDDMKEEFITVDKESDLHSKLFHFGQHHKVTKITKQKFKFIDEEDLSIKYNNYLNQWNEKYIKIIVNDNIFYFKSFDKAKEFYNDSNKIYDNVKITNFKVRKQYDCNYSEIYYFFNEEEANLKFKHESKYERSNVFLEKLIF